MENNVKTESESELRIRAALRYRHDGLEIIRAVKFSADRRYHRIWILLILLMIDDLGLADKDGLTLVPVPSSATGLFYRGWDPVALATRRAATLLGASYWPCLRSSRGKSQKFLDKAQRGRELGMTFDSTQPTQARSRNSIVLVDDVITTGATLRGAAGLLSQLGFLDVCAIALAAD